MLHQTMWNYIVKFFFSISPVLMLYSCCNDEDRHYWYPEEAIRYYEENDTITFFSEETGLYETYPVCDRNQGFTGWEHKGTWCYYVEFNHSISYTLPKDSCQDSCYFWIEVDAGFDNEYYSVHVNRNYGHTRDYFVESILEINSAPVEVLGYSYENTFEILNGKYGKDSIKSVLFSCEYGIIQYKLEEVTYSLVNNGN